MLDAASARKFPRLEAFLAENWTPLRRSEGHRGLLSTCRAGGDSLHALATNSPAGRAARPLAFTGLASLRLVLEVLVGEKLLFTGRPDKLCAAVHAPENPVLELHRSLTSSRRSFELVPGPAYQHPSDVADDRLR